MALPNPRKCPVCGGKLSHKMDCPRRDWRPSRVHKESKVGKIVENIIDGIGDILEELGK